MIHCLISPRMVLVRLSSLSWKPHRRYISWPAADDSTHVGSHSASAILKSCRTIRLPMPRRWYAGSAKRMANSGRYHFSGGHWHR